MGIFHTQFAPINTLLRIFPPVYIFNIARKVPAVVSKRGVDDGNQKGGGSPQPAQENQFHSIKNKTLVKYLIRIFVRNRKIFLKPQQKTSWAAQNEGGYFFLMMFLSSR
jgi:hypothetical protein